jgi:4-amino-4-deoxy-L-arabinose transferase-like glycosyltransferase
MRFDQERPTACVLDVLRNGHWICQRDQTGDLTWKPPLYTWLAALAASPFKTINRFLVSAPAIASTLAVALIVGAVGRAQFGWLAGFLGALAYVETWLTAKQVILVRTDGLFALTVVLTALGAWQAWIGRASWFWFWMGAAAATLTKGPLGLGLGAAGLVAVLWERRRGPQPTRPGTGHGVGIAVYLLLTAGWLALAYWRVGSQLIDQLFVQEIYGNAVHAHDMTVWPGRWFHKPPLYFLVQMAPWSVVACIGLWRVWTRPASDDTERRFERFLMCWFLVGLAPFCLGASQRADHLMPLAPAAALLAGRELAQFAHRWQPATVLWTAVLTAAVFLVLMCLHYDFALRRNRDIVRTVGMQQLAVEVREHLGDNPPLEHIDDPFTLQFYLNTWRAAVSFPRAVELLRQPTPVYVAVRDFNKLEQAMGANAPPLYTLARWPKAGEPFVRIVGNRPPPERGPR